MPNDGAPNTYVRATGHGGTYRREDLDAIVDLLIKVGPVEIHRDMYTYDIVDELALEQRKWRQLSLGTSGPAGRLRWRADKGGVDVTANIVDEDGHTVFEALVNIVEERRRRWRWRVFASSVLVGAFSSLVTFLVTLTVGVAAGEAGVAALSFALLGSLLSALVALVHGASVVLGEHGLRIGVRENLRRLSVRLLTIAVSLVLGVVVGLRIGG